MTPTNTSEKELERIISDSLITQSGYITGSPEDFDRDHAVDLPKLQEFLQRTQPKVFEQLGLEEEGPKRL